jgi:hypothetical protein
VSAVNSLNGSATGDLVGNSGVIVLTNGNCVVRGPLWDSPALVGGWCAAKESNLQPTD